MNDLPNAAVSSAQQSSKPRGGVGLFLWQWFWRVMLVVGLVSAWYCFYVPANSVAWAKNYTAAQQQAAESGKPMLLFVTGQWCVPCRIMKRNVWADNEVAASVNNGFIPVTIDFDDASTADLLTRYKVTSTPHTIIIDSQGSVLAEKNGGMAKADFLDLLNKSLATN